MSYQLNRENIINVQDIVDAFATVAKGVKPFMESIKEVANESVRLNEALGNVGKLKEIISVSQQTNKVKIQQNNLEKQALDIAAKTRAALIQEQRLKQQKITTDSKIIDNLKKEEQLKQATLRTEKMQQQQAQKLTRVKGGLSAAFDRLVKSIGVYAAAIFGLNRVVRFFTSDLLKLTVKLDSLDYSMKTVITSQKEYAQTQLFLSETAINYGQDILTLTERYIKFRAATKQSNMSVQDTQKIFDSAAKAAAVLGLRTDEVNGVFLALEQMISKGKVTTEELRRQLGERLPGAFGIMADAMGVTIRELDKMLKAGEVLSSDALPKFAVALEEAYGIEAVNKVNTLAAAQGRLKTSWVDFVDELEASRVYINVLNVLSQRLNAIKLIFSNPSLKEDTAEYFTMLEQGLTKSSSAAAIFGRLMMNISPILGAMFLKNASAAGKQAVAFKSFIEEMNKFEKEGVSKTEEYFKQRLTEIGFSLEDAEILYGEYLNRVQKTNQSDKFQVFDVETFKKDLDRVKSDAESLANVQSEELKKSIIESNKYLTDEVRTYKEVLTLQEKEINFSRQRAKGIVEDFERLKTRRDLTKEENEDYEQWSNRFIALTEAQIEINNRLAESNGGKKGKDDSLKLMQERHKLELEETKKHQQELIAQGKYSDDELQRVKYDNNKELLEQEIRNVDEQLELVKSGTVEHARLLTERKKLEADLAKDLTDFLIDEEKRRQREIERQAKEDRDEKERLNNEILANAEQRTHEEYLDLLDKANQEIKASKGKADEIRRIDDQLTLDLIRNEIKQLDTALESMDKETKAYEQAVERRKRLKEQEGEQENRIEGRTQEKSIELKEATMVKSGELLMEGFNLAGTIYDAQLADLDAYYKSEIAAAGDSVERRILAEKKYEREKAKLLRRQAIADKAQSALSIILNTAEAIMQAWANFPATAGVLTAIISAIGATQLATVLAAPIPQFAKGTKDAPETFIAGEKGIEAIVKPSGDVLITPNEPTLFSDKSLIGSTILPHDQTQKMLANYAISQSYDMIDMSDTNKYLKSIANNTRRNKEVFIRNGKTVIRRGYVTSTLV